MLSAASQALKLIIPEVAYTPITGADARQDLLVKKLFLSEKVNDALENSLMNDKERVFFDLRNNLKNQIEVENQLKTVSNGWYSGNFYKCLRHDIYYVYFLLYSILLLLDTLLAGDITEFVKLVVYPPSKFYKSGHV